MGLYDVVQIKPDGSSHIKIKNEKICQKKCDAKCCTYYCPSGVFIARGNTIDIDYTRCIECGACPYGCPNQNIAWEFPRGGFGVVYKY
jgi:ferredoxin like protein